MSNDAYVAVCVAAVIIVLGLSLGRYNNQVVAPSRSPAAHYVAEPTNPLSFMSNWDGPNYITIATHGYQDIGSTNFFPLYPILIHLVNQVIDSPLDSALLIAWLGFIGAIYFYLKIVKQLFHIKRNEEALRGVALFVLFPTAMFMLATYTESLFCCLALGAIYFALNKRYWPTAGLAFLMSATHITGPLVLLLIFMLLLEAGAPLVKAVATTLVGAGGLIAYIIFLAIRFNHPLGFITAQKSHGWLGYGYHNFIGSANMPGILTALLLVVAVVYWWHRRKSFAIYSAFFLLIPLVGREWGGFPRYALEAFPLQLMLYGYLRHKQTAYAFCLALSAIAWTYFLLQYAGGYVGG